MNNEEQSAAIAKVRDMHNVQRVSGNWNHNDYMRGFYNGLECALAILDDRDPEYKSMKFCQECGLLQHFIRSTKECVNEENREVLAQE